MSVEQPIDLVLRLIIPGLICSDDFKLETVAGVEILQLGDTMTSSTIYFSIHSLTCL